MLCFRSEICNLNGTYTLCVWVERAVLGCAKTALKFKYEI